MSKTRRPVSPEGPVRGAEAGGGPRLSGQRAAMGSAAGLTFFRLIAEHGTDVASVHTRAGEFVFVAPTALRLFGWKDSALLGDSLVGLCHEEDRLKLELALRVESGQTEKVAYRVRCADGEEKWVETVVQTGPSPDLVVCMTRDVSEHKRAAHALERGMRTIMDRAPEAMLLVQARRVLHANQAAARALGAVDRDLAGRSLRALLHPDDASEEGERIGDVEESSDRSLPLHDVRFVRGDGSVLLARAFAVAVAHAGRGAALVAFHERPLEGDALVRERLRAIGDVAAELARDLADPLSLLASSIEALRRHREHDDAEREILGEAQAASERALGALRTLARLERGELPAPSSRGRRGADVTARPPNAGSVPPPSGRGRSPRGGSLRAPPRTTVRAGRRPTVLMIDDDAALGASLKRLLKNDYEVTLESSAESAWRRLRAGETFDVVVSDVLLPDMSGIELYELIEKDAPAVASRFLFMTGGFALPAVKENLVRFPNAETLDKPFSPDDLRERIRAIAARARD
ncbi:MAG: PAS domain S-box protein [Polyangiaceae bacterium]